MIKLGRWREMEKRKKEREREREPEPINRVAKQINPKEINTKLLGCAAPRLTHVRSESDKRHMAN